MVTMTKMGSSASIWNGRNIVRWMTDMIDQSCFSCSAYKSLLPIGSSFTSLFFFFNKMTGAYVSGRKMIMMVVHSPAKIIITQNTNLQETELSTMLKRELSYIYIVMKRITHTIQRLWVLPLCRERVQRRKGSSQALVQQPTIYRQSHLSKIL